VTGLQRGIDTFRMAGVVSANQPVVAQVAPPAAPMEMNVAQPPMFKQYLIKHTLGSGLQGKVKLGIDTNTNRPVALKIVDKSKVGERELQNLIKEIKSMKMMKSHPSVLQLVEVLYDEVYHKKNGSSIRAIVIVLELAEGGELLDFMMHTGRFSEQVARTYFLQLIDGLAACHAKGISHRDIKPENLLLDKFFHLKIADFGLSAIHETAMGGVTELYTQVGTKGYMAPEILNNQPYNGQAADVWAAGVVLFIMLSGFPPFQIANRQDWWFRAIASNQYDAFWAAHSRSCVFSPSAMSLLTQIFTIDPTKRITIPKMLEHPWIQGPRVSNRDLYNDLRNRKMKMEEQKIKQRQIEENDSMKRARGEPTPTGSMTEAREVRASTGEGVGPTRSVLPQRMSSDQVMTDRESISTDSSSRKTMDRSNSSKDIDARLPQEDGEKNLVTRYTHFYSHCSPEDLYMKLKDTFSHMNVKCCKVDDNCFKLKFSVACGTDPFEAGSSTVGGANQTVSTTPSTSMMTPLNLVFKVCLVRSPEFPQYTKVVFARNKGCSMKFQEIYRMLRTSMTEFIADDVPDEVGEAIKNLCASKMKKAECRRV